MYDDTHIHECKRMRYLILPKQRDKGTGSSHTSRQTVTVPCTAAVTCACDVIAFANVRTQSTAPIYAVPVTCTVLCACVFVCVCGPCVP